MSISEDQLDDVAIGNLAQLPFRLEVDQRYGFVTLLTAVPALIGPQYQEDLARLGVQDKNTGVKELRGTPFSQIQIVGDDVKLAARSGIATELVAVLYPEVLEADPELGTDTELGADGGAAGPFGEAAPA